MNMTDKEKQTQIALGTYLPMKWEERSKLLTERDQLRVDADKLEAESDRLYAEGDKLAEGTERSKLWVEGRKLQAEVGRMWTAVNALFEEGRKLYIDAIIEIHGPQAIAKINWTNGEVKV